MSHQEQNFNINTDLTFNQMSKMNRLRRDNWHESMDESTNWSIVDWSNAAAGEMGECCNAVKKYRRVMLGTKASYNPTSREQAIQKIAEEIGGTIIYLDLLADCIGMTLEEVIKYEFNRVSEREGLPQKL